MNKRQKNICFIMLFFAIALLAYFSFNYYGFLNAFFIFICLLSSGLGVFALMAPMFLAGITKNKMTKEQYFWLIFFPTLYALIFAFGIFYSGR